MDKRPYSVGPGWWPMLDLQMAKAKKIVPDVIIHDEKEKYGRCDVMLWSESRSGSCEELSVIESEIEDRSLQICENCGRPGRPREDRSWVKTYCDRCAALDQRSLREVADEVASQYFKGRYCRLEHKGILGSIDYSEPDEVYFGKILNVDGLFSYEGKTLEDLTADFKCAAQEAERFIHGSYLRNGQKTDRDRVRKKHLQDFLDAYKKFELISCPVCGQPAKIEEGMQDYFVFCSENCTAPKCEHHDPKHTAISWNDWARWYMLQEERTDE